jgi:hypothetical protein
MAVGEADAGPVRSVHGDGFLPLLGAEELHVLEAWTVLNDVLDVLRDHDPEVVVRRVGPAVLAGAGADGAVVGRYGHVVERRAPRGEGLQSLGVEALHGANLVGEAEVVCLGLAGDVPEPLGRVTDVGEDDAFVPAYVLDVVGDVCDRPPHEADRILSAPAAGRFPNLKIRHADN